MRRKENTIARLLIFIIIGLLIGGVLGESMGLVLGQIGEWTSAGNDNPVKNFFVKAFEFNLGMDDGILVDLYLVKFRIGFGFKLNVVSILGMIISLNIMKWSGDR